MKMLGRKFFERDTILVARELLGKKIVRVYRGKRIEGIIMETEAYRGLDDKASHASRGKTERTSIMFDHAGTICVYLIYGMYYCLKIDKKLNEKSLSRKNGIWIEEGIKISQKKIKKAPRIGVDYAGRHWAGKLWRFYIKSARV